jgi:hypothetical protein
MRRQGNTPADCLFLQEKVDAWLPTAKSLYSRGEPGKDKKNENLERSHSR